MIIFNKDFTDRPEDATKSVRVSPVRPTGSDINIYKSWLKLLKIIIPKGIKHE